jgi:hypothetical protein
VVGITSDKTAKALGGDPDKQLPEGWNDIDSRTGEPVGIDKGWGYMPGETVADTIRSLMQKKDSWPAEIWSAYVASLPAEIAAELADGGAV